MSTYTILNSYMLYRLSFQLNIDGQSLKYIAKDQFKAGHTKINIKYKPYKKEQTFDISNSVPAFKMSQQSET